MLNRINIYFFYISGLISSCICRLLGPDKKAWGKAGQMISEYALLAILVVTAIITVRLYLQRGLQGRYKAATDYAVRVLLTTRNLYTQYDPYYVNEEYMTQSDSMLYSGAESGATSKGVDAQRFRWGESLIPPYRGQP